MLVALAAAVLLASSSAAAESNTTVPWWHHAPAGPTSAWRQRCQLSNDTIFFIHPDIPFDMSQFQKLVLLIDLCYKFDGGRNPIRIGLGCKEEKLIKVGDWYDTFKLIFVGKVQPKGRNAMPA